MLLIRLMMASGAASTPPQKLLNNALATYNLAATARMLNTAAEHGVPSQDLFEVIGVSTGRNWMSDNFIGVQYDLLLDSSNTRGVITKAEAVPNPAPDGLGDDQSIRS